VQVLQAKAYYTPEEIEARAGQYISASEVETLLQEDTDVYKPDGSILLKFRKRTTSSDSAMVAYKELSQTKNYFPGENNRGTATGKSRRSEKVSEKVIRKAGFQSNTVASPLPVRSGVVGYFDRYTRIPYCRQSAFNLRYPKEFRLCVPFIRAINNIFSSECRDRYAAQLAVVKQTSPDFYIRDTVFTTVTVNKNWQTAIHVDAGDLKEGFGVMTAFSAGTYDGCYLVFPRYRIGVDMRTTDVLLADVHEYHGNTPFIGRSGQYNRISCVFYYRSNMRYCGTAQEELERAKNRKPGDPLYPEKLTYGERHA